MAELWVQLHEYAQQQYDALELKPTRRELFKNGLRLSLLGLRKLMSSAPTAEANSPSLATTLVEGVPHEVNELWVKLHEEAVRRVKDLDPTYIENEDRLSWQELFAVGAGQITEALMPKAMHDLYQRTIQRLHPKSG